MRNMNKALNIVLSSFQSLQSVSDSPIDSASLQVAKDALADVSVTVNQMEEEIRQAAEAQDDYTDRVKGSQGAANSLVGTVKRLAATYVTMQTAKKAIDTADAWSQTSARMNMMVREGENVDEIQQKIFESANRSRAAYMDTADVITKIGLRAGEAFNSTDEIIAFTETLNKMYAISGASAEEQKSSLLQLTQALGSGVLRGEEFNAVFEAAPNIMQAVADYMDVPIGSLREMASEGQITAEIVKGAMFNAAEEVNKDFRSMPATFSQAFNLFSNQALMAFQPVWQKLGEISSSQEFLDFANMAGMALAGVANMAVAALDMMAQGAEWVMDNWSIISPVIFGVIAAVAMYISYLGIMKAAQIAGKAIEAAACLVSYAHAALTRKQASETAKATAKQYAFNTALLSCPLTWIILIIIAVIAVLYAVVAAINKITGSTYSATGIIMGILSVAVAFICNLFLALIETVFSVVNAMVNPFVNFANFIANLFVDPIGAVIHLFGDMADGILAILEKIASAIDLVFGSNLADAVSGWRGTLSAKVEGAASKYGNGKYQKVVDSLNLSMEGTGMERFNYGNAWDKGYAKGNEWGDKLSGLFSGNKGKGLDSAFDYQGMLDSINSGVGETAANTGKDVDISDENLKYMRDLAEQETINRFTTAEIKVDMVNNNSVSSGMDLDGIVSYLVAGVQTSMEQAAEGVHA